MAFASGVTIMNVHFFGRKQLCVNGQFAGWRINLGCTLDTDRAQALIEQFLDAYNRFEIEGMMELVDPEIEFRNVSGGDVDTTAIGQDEFRELAEQSAFLFSSRKQTPTNIQAEDDVVSVDIDFVGTLATDIPDGPKAGEELRVAGRSEFVFRDEKIYRLTDFS